MCWNSRVEKLQLEQSVEKWLVKPVAQSEISSNMERISILVHRVKIIIENNNILLLPRAEAMHLARNEISYFIV